MNLKPLSNETLLSDYVDYFNNYIRAFNAYTNATKKEDKTYWYDKMVWKKECLTQIKTEILRRMSEHKEID